MVGLGLATLFIIALVFILIIIVRLVYFVIIAIITVIFVPSTCIARTPALIVRVLIAVKEHKPRVRLLLLSQLGDSVYHFVGHTSGM